MRLSRRRIIVATASTAVVATMTSASTFALADDVAVAAAPPVHLIVGYKQGAGSAAAAPALSAAGARITTATGRGRQAMAALNAQTVQVSSSSSAGVIAALKQDPNVAYVEVDRVAKATDLAPNDPQYVAGNQPEPADVAGNVRTTSKLSYHR